LEVSFRLTPLATTLLWCSGFGILSLLQLSGYRASPLLLGFVSLLFLLFLASLLLGRIAIRALVPSALEPATGFTWEEVPVRFGLHHVGGLFAARDVLLYHGSDLQRRGLFAYRAQVQPGSSVWIEGNLRLPRRGRSRTHGLRIASTFPFGLLRWTSAWELPADLLALPRLGALRDTTSLVPPERETLEAHAERHRDAEEFHTLKRWRPGMSQRQVHWKSSARRGQLMLREMQGLRYPRLRIELVAPLPALQARGQRKHRFEQAICLTASLADDFLRRNYRVEVVFQGGKQGFFLGAQRGRQGLFRILTRLAEVEMVKHGEASGNSTIPHNGDAQRRSHDVYRLQVCVGLGNLRQAGRQRLDVMDPATHRWFHADRRFSRVHLAQERRA
ncbi:MAG: DUF58 domain-containing protein, partial [Planctomycetota bacterium]